jgi:hypothetical protein
MPPIRLPERFTSGLCLPDAATLIESLWLGRNAAMRASKARRAEQRSNRQSADDFDPLGVF